MYKYIIEILNTHKNENGILFQNKIHTSNYINITSITIILLTTVYGNTNMITEYLYNFLLYFPRLKSGSKTKFILVTTIILLMYYII